MTLKWHGGLKNDNGYKYGKIAKESVASEILIRIEGLASRAEAIRDRVGEKLHSVCMPEAPSPMVDEKTETSEKCYPPYFTEIRDRLLSLDNSLDRISDMLDRCEL